MDPQILIHIPGIFDWTQCEKPASMKECSSGHHRFPLSQWQVRLFHLLYLLLELINSRTTPLVILGSSALKGFDHEQVCFVIVPHWDLPRSRVAEIRVEKTWQGNLLFGPRQGDILLCIH
jgi:hypothetical protein